MKLKRILLRGFVLAMAICLVLPISLTSCSSRGKTLVYLDKYEISTNLYQLMLTQQKGTMAYAIHSAYGDMNSPTFWDMTVDYQTQATNEEFYNNQIIERAKNYVCALKLYDELKSTKSDFKMPDSYTECINKAIDDLIEFDGNGSKTALNKILSDYGINVKMLREFLIMDAKANYVIDYLYGADGAKIGEEVKKEFYENNYVACKQILIQKFYYVYEQDKDGNDIYFDPETAKPIYDTSKTPAVDKDGHAVFDENDNRVYYNDDGSIAYDTKNGERKVKMNESGKEEYKKYTDEELAALKQKAQELAAKAQNEDLNGFDILRRENSDDYDDADATNGMMYYATNVKYFSVSSEFLDELAQTLGNMKVGEVRLLESDLSYNVIMKTELETGAYSEEKYEGYFKDELFGVYDFISNLKLDLYSARLEKYKADVVVDQKVLESLDFSISNVTPNYYYPDPDISYYLYTGEE